MTEPPAIVRQADDACQALRAINHLTAHGAIPAPLLYDVLGNHKQLGPALTRHCAALRLPRRLRRRGSDRLVAVVPSSL